MTTVALPSYPMRAVHLAALWAYAVAQPVFSLLEGNPEFLVVRGSTRLEVLVFALLLVAGPPLLGVAGELILRPLSRTASDAFHLVLLGTFAFPLALQIVKHAEPGSAIGLAGASALALLVVYLYARAAAARLFLTVSAALPAAGLVLFVVGIPLANDDAAGAQVQARSTTPVVMVVFDELPVSSLMDPSGHLDAVRYPNFARLARDGTWYAGATTVAEHTTMAVPALLTGNRPRRAQLPVLADHPRNLFTLLGETYDIRSQEVATHLCPRRYCPRHLAPLTDRLYRLFMDVRVAYLHRVLPTSLATGVPSISDRWGGFDDATDRSTPELLLAARDEEEVNRALIKHANDPRPQFEHFLGTFSADEAPRTLHFLHVLLPHVPWRFLPSGAEYTEVGGNDGQGRDWGDLWDHDPWLVAQAYQRHLLQLGYTDRLLGRLLDSLVASGMYEQALIVVVADHGASFVADGRRRQVTSSNLADISRIPLFIKVPGQTVGHTETRSVRTIDVLPTIADALGVQLPWKVDGRSLLRGGSAKDVVEVSRRDGTVVRANAAQVERQLEATVQRKNAVFGSRRSSLYAPRDRPALVGVDVSVVPVERTWSNGVQINGEDQLRDARLSTGLIPARITGQLKRGSVPENGVLAVAVNGRVSAVTRAFRQDGRLRFAAVADPKEFHDGFNTVEVFVVRSQGSSLTLRSLGANDPADQYVLDASGKQIRARAGLSLQVLPNRLAGRVESWTVDSGTARLRGWAADLRHEALVDSVLLFVSGRLLYSGETTNYRWDVSETRGVRGLERAGWTISLPADALESGVVKVFAVRGSIASELPRPRSPSGK